MGYDSPKSSDPNMSHANIDTHLKIFADITKIFFFRAKVNFCHFPKKNLHNKDSPR